MLANLLNNAAKYTAGRRPHRTLAARWTMARWCWRCSDNGIGIAADMLPPVFDLFAQATATPAARRAAWASA